MFSQQPQLLGRCYAQIAGPSVPPGSLQRDRSTQLRKRWMVQIGRRGAADELGRMLACDARVLLEVRIVAHRKVAAEVTAPALFAREGGAGDKGCDGVKVAQLKRGPFVRRFKSGAQAREQSRSPVETLGIAQETRIAPHDAAQFSSRCGLIRTRNTKLANGSHRVRVRHLRRQTGRLG